MFSKLPNKRVCVVGDIVVDHYRTVVAKRVSPEAPILIVKEEYEEFLPGGAANVVANLSALKLKSSTLIGVVGEKNKDLFDKLKFSDQPVFEVEQGRMTTVKERIVSRRQQILRIDEQSDAPIGLDTAEKLFNRAKPALEAADAIIFSDYAHGVCIPELVLAVLRLAEKSGIPTIVDSKAPDTVSKYRGATIALPNMDEARTIARLEDFDDQDVANYLMKSMKLKALAITLGPKGIFLTTPEESKVYPPLHPDTDKEVTDVTGAGDTVAAIAAAGLISGLRYDEIVRLANIAAGIKVQKRGVATVSGNEIEAAIKEHGEAIFLRDK